MWGLQGPPLPAGLPRCWSFPRNLSSAYARLLPRWLPSPELECGVHTGGGGGGVGVVLLGGLPGCGADSGSLQVSGA